MSRLCSPPCQELELGGTKLTGRQPSHTRCLLDLAFVDGCQSSARGGEGLVTALPCTRPQRDPTCIPHGRWHSLLCSWGLCLVLLLCASPRSCFYISSCFSKCKTPETTCQSPSHLAASDGLFIPDRQTWVPWSSR